MVPSGRFYCNDTFALVVVRLFRLPWVKTFSTQLNAIKSFLGHSNESHLARLYLSSHTKSKCTNLAL